MAQIEGNVKINVNGNQAEQGIRNLERRASELRSEIIAIRKEKIIDANQVKLLEKELRSVEKTQRDLHKSAVDYKTVLNNLSGASLKELKRAYDQLNRELNTLDRNTVEWKQKASHLGSIKAEMNEVKAKMNGINTSVHTSNGFISKLTDGFNKFGGIGLSAVAGITAAVTGLVLIFKKLMDINTQFEESFSTVLTQLTGDQIKQFGDQLENGAIDTMKKFGIEATDVNTALFDTISAGVDAAKSIEVLNAAGILATGGVTDLSIASDGLTTILNAFHLSTDQATNIANAFFTAQKFGKTTVEELSQEIGKVAPIMNAAGISYQEMLSALAELTKNGIDTAAATTYLKGSIQSLIKPTDEAAKILKEYGVPVGVTEIKAAGLGKTLQALNDMMMKNPDIVAKAIPNLEGLTGIMAMSGKSMEDFNVILNEVNTDIGDGSSLMQAYGIKSETTSFKMKQAKAEFNATALQLADQLNPAIISATNFTKKITIALIDAIIQTKKYGKSINELGDSFGKNLTPAGETQKSLNDKVDEFQSKVNKGFKDGAKAVFNFGMAEEKYAVKPLMILIHQLSNIGSVIIKAFSTLFNNLKTSGEKTKESLKPALDWFEKIFKPIGNWLSTFGDSFRNLGIGIDNTFIKLKRFFDLLDKTKQKENVINGHTYDDGDNRGSSVQPIQNNPLINSTIQNYANPNWEPDIIPIDNPAVNPINNADKIENKDYSIPKSNLKEYLDFVRDTNKELIQDEQKKAIEEANIWKQQEKEKINGWEISERQKNDALLLLDKEYNQKIELINKEAEEKKKKAIEDITMFLQDKEQKLFETKEQFQQKEIEKIEKQYDDQITLAKNLMVQYPELREQMLNKISELELMKQDEINKYKLEKEEEFQQKILEAREQYGLVSEAERVQLELQQLDDLYAEKLLTEEEYQNAKQLIIDRHNKKELEEAEKLEEEKFKTKQKGLQEIDTVINAYSDFYAQQQQNELELAGENEDKKKEINKKYAQINLEITQAKIITATALAVMQALAELGPVAGPVAAGLMTATGLLQLDAAQTQYNKIMGMEKGGKIPVIRSQDNQKFNATYTNSRGIIATPSILVAENGPEYVVPNEGLQNPYIVSFLSMIENARQRGQIKSFNPITAKGYEKGGITEVQQPISISNNDELSQKLDILITSFLQLSQKIDTWANSLTVDYQSFSLMNDKINKIKTNSKL